MGKCFFNPEWLKDEKYVEWLASDVNNQEKFFCRVCNYHGVVGSSGIKALNSHMKSIKHNKLFDAAKQSKSLFKFVKSAASPTVATTTTSSPATPPVTRTLDAYVSDEKVLSAEIRWVMHLVSSHSSARSSDEITCLFKSMFPDSNIAQRFQCARTKAGYLAAFGLAPALKEVLTKQVKDCDFFVILFDESFNSELQKKQLDVHFRFIRDDVVITKYFTSFFLGHARAADIEKVLKDVISSVGNNNMLQISMDGPNVNWKVFKDISAEIDKAQTCQLVNIGSCGLHILHNGFKDGVKASGWDISCLLRSVYYLFQESPARRDDFFTVTKSTLLPLQFCGHRWLENVETAERFVVIWQDVKTYVKACRAGTTSEPTCKSFKVIADSMKDNTIIVKVHCFTFLAKILKPFLVKYQSNDPLAPFLASDLFDIIKRLYILIVKDETCESFTMESVPHPSKVEKDSFKDRAAILLGCAAEGELKRLHRSKEASELDLLAIRLSFQKFVIKIIIKILDKGAIAYNFARNITCLDPKNLKRDNSLSLFKNLVRYLHNRRWLTSDEVDAALFDYTSFKELPLQHETGRLDTMIKNCSDLDNMPALKKVYRLVLTLSHGNAEVERGFSVNKEVSVENMADESIVAKRLICQYVKENGGAASASLGKALLSSCSGSYQRYKLACEEKRKALERDGKVNERKRKMDELKDMSSKKRKIELDIDMLLKKADDLAEEAEQQGCSKKSYGLVVQSNALRKDVKGKRGDIASLSASIQALEGELEM